MYLCSLLITCGICTRHSLEGENASCCRTGDCIYGYKQSHLFVPCSSTAYCLWHISCASIATCKGTQQECVGECTSKAVIRQHEGDKPVESTFFPFMRFLHIGSGDDPMVALLSNEIWFKVGKQEIFIHCKKASYVVSARKIVVRISVLFFLRE